MIRKASLLFAACIAIAAFASSTARADVTYHATVNGRMSLSGGEYDYYNLVVYTSGKSTFSMFCFKDSKSGFYWDPMPATGIDITTSHGVFSAPLHIKKKWYTVTITVDRNDKAGHSASIQVVDASGNSYYSRSGKLDMGSLVWLTPFDTKK